MRGVLFLGAPGLSMSTSSPSRQLRDVVTEIGAEPVRYTCATTVGSVREIRRCIKRYLARHLYRTLNALYTTPAMT